MGIEVSLYPESCCRTNRVDLLRSMTRKSQERLLRQINLVGLDRTTVNDRRWRRPTRVFRPVLSSEL
jgi:hypothetical protein